MHNYRNNPNYCRSATVQNPKYNYNKNRCSCDSTPDDFLKDYSLAMAYVPIQQWEKPYEIEKALQIGTIFSELNKPFTGKGGCR